jgi:DNA-binding protein H-NS
MSIEDLRKLQADVSRAIDSFEERRRKAAAAKVAELARSLGYSVHELSVIGQKSGERRPDKYANPDDASQRWSGRGRQPAWYKEAIEAGRDPKDFLIS